MSLSVAVHGSGVAACACVRLLQQHLIPPTFHVEQRSHGPILLLNTATQRLLGEIFAIDGNFFFGLHRIRRRVVRWGNAAAVDLPHDGFAILESVLLEKLWRMTESSANTTGNASFHIYSNSRSTNIQEVTFGSRYAQNLRVEIEASASDTCWVESLPSGWLFLLPYGAQTASLLAIGGEPEKMLKESTLIALQIGSVLEAMPRCAVSPRIVTPLCASDWLACGSAAMTFDPICGEGVGHALREALLACACLTNSNPASALAEYAPRLMLGFLKHLEVCRGFYAAIDGEWWACELAHLERGIRWMHNQASYFSPPRYRVVGSELKLI